MRILFFGTPSYTIPYLDQVNDRHEIVGVVSVPDKSAGRGLKLISPPPAKWALKNNIPLFQPNSLKDETFHNTIQQLNADVGIVIAYGKLIPEKIFNTPEQGCINLHFSLLPRFRGASPVESSLLAGDKLSGVSLQRITKELDAGDILCNEEVPVEENDHYPELFKKLLGAGSVALDKALNLLGSMKAVFSPQDNSKISTCSKITAEDRQIDWNNKAKDIVNRIRAFSGIRTAFTFVNEKKILLHRAQLEQTSGCNEPGIITQANKHGLIIGTPEGSLFLLEVQPENKRKMDAVSFINGSRIQPGIIFKADKGATK